ncbi:MAG: InlB B-repeat-containing protein, partial [Pygmaiobacter sp.]|nr:InlB B-repeat-containing protein [Pygmaiobacter sp.]
VFDVISSGDYHGGDGLLDTLDSGFLKALDSGVLGNPSVTLDSGVPDNEVLSLCRLYLLARQAAEQPDATEEQIATMTRLEENFEKAFSPIRTRYEEYTELSPAEREDETVLAEYADTIQTYRAVDRMLSGEYALSASLTTMALLGVPMGEAVWGVAKADGSAPDDWANTGTLVDAVAYANGLESGTAYIQLQSSSISIYNTLTIDTGKTAVLDLNGSSILAENWPMTILTVDGTLTLKDTSSDDVTMQGKLLGLASDDAIGVYVRDGGNFTMEAGTISNRNPNNKGRGVKVVKGTFTMTGGSITENTVTGVAGGGVWVENGTFNLSGGSISKNTAGAGGGGVVLFSSTFTMTGGSITNNSTNMAAAKASGGGVENNWSTFVMTGGEISGNNAGTGGGVQGDGFTVGGTAKITGNTAGDSAIVNNISLNANDSSKILTVSSETPLESGASFGISMNRLTPITTEKPANITGANTADVSAYFFSDNDAYAVQNGTDNIVQLVTAPSYQAAWGVAKADGSAPDSWVSSGNLTDAVEYAKNSGSSTTYIQLLSNVNTTSALGFGLDRTVILDLNGRTIKSTAGSGASVLDVYSAITITDSSSNDVTAQGKITGASNAFNGAVCVGFGGLFTMNGGNITGNSGSSAGVFVFNGNFVMNGGSISDNHSANTGGGVSVSNNGNFTMNGGSITNNTAQYGGGVAATGNSFTMTGGSITNNTAQCGGGVATGNSFTMTGGSITNNTAENSGGVYAYNNITVGGTAVITGNTSGTVPDTVASNVCLMSDPDLPLQYTLSISASKPLVKGASIGVRTEIVPTQANPVTFTGKNDSDYSSYFTSDNAAYVVQNSGSGNAQAVQLAIACEARWGDSNTDGSVNWISSGTLADALRYANSDYAYNSGYIQLQGNVKTTSTLNFDKQIILDLNGKTIDANKGNFSVLTLNNGSATTANGGGMYVQPGGSVRIEGGNITGNAAENGGGVYVTGTFLSPSMPGNFAIAGGKISGNTASASGGGVYVNRYGHMQQYKNCSIENNFAENGGGVYVVGTKNDKISSFTMQGGSITENTAKNGGGLYFQGNASNMINGRIADNTASESGGGVFVADTSGSLTVKNTSTISGNTAKNGGGVYVNGDLKLESGSIANNTASENGGGAYIDYGYGFTMSGGSVADNTANKNGGGVYAGSSAFIMTGGSVTGNSSRQENGGGVYAPDSHFFVGGKAVVTDNTKGEAGAAVANNVYLPKYIRVVYADVHFSAPSLTTGARIGVTTEIAPVKGTPVDITNVKQNTDNSGYFFSDNDAYMVKNSTGTIYCQVQLTAAPEARWGLAGTGGAAPTTWAGSGDLTEAVSYAGRLSSFNTAYIQLLSDVNTNVGLRFDTYKSAILDLNGKTVSSQIKNTDSVLVVFGNLTLTDSSSTDVTKQGRITGNIGADGGGAYVYGGKFAMSGGNITGNTVSKNGGGVYVGFNGSFTMTGGSISKNGTSSAVGIGGVYVDSGTLTVGGTAVIAENTKGTDKVPSNMCLRIGKAVTVSPTLTTGASIGVTAQQIPTSTKPVDITGKNNADYSKYFTSDSDMYLVQNSGSGSNQVVQLALNPASSGPVITTTSLSNGVIGTAYSQTLAVSGKTPITWSISSGALPAGLSLNASTGVISGTPTMTGTSSFTVKATNGITPDATKALSITVISPITSVSVSPASATVKKTKTQQFTANVTATDSTAKTVTWSVSGGTASSISTDGLLTVSGRETATTLTVKATSIADSNRFGTATVTVAAAPNVYTVTFDSDGGSAIAAVGNVEEGSAIKMPDPPTKENHRFDGWYTGKSGSGKQFTAATAVTASITVYAKWTKLVTVSGIVVEEEGEAPVSGATVTLSPTYGTTAVTTAAD